jgi:PKD repeat protein
MIIRRPKVVRGSILRAAIILSLGAVLFSCDLFNTSDDFFGKGNGIPTPDAGVDQTIALGSIVFLDASNSNDPENEILYYSWEVIQVPTGSSVNSSSLSTRNSFYTSFQPDVTGDYVVMVKVSDSSGSASDFVYVSVLPLQTNEPPMVNFDLNLNSSSGVQLVSMNFYVSASDPDGSISNYYWDFGDGNTQEGSSLSTVSHSFEFEGTYTIEVIVEDNLGETAIDTLSIGIVSSSTNPAPSPYFKVSETVVDVASGPVSIQFKDFSSNLVNESGGRDIAGYEWDFDGDGTVDSNIEGTMSFTYDTPGYYLSNLTIYESEPGNRIETYTVGISVLDSTNLQTMTVEPVADISLRSDDQLVNDSFVQIGIVNGADGEKRYSGLLRYDFDGISIPTFISAKLVLNYGNYEGKVNRIDLQVYEIPSSQIWDEESTPGYEELYLNSLLMDKLIISKFDRYELDISSLVLSWLKGNQNNGIAIEPFKQPGGDGVTKFLSHESGFPEILIEIQYQ